MRALRSVTSPPLELVDHPVARLEAAATRYSAADDFDAFYRREFPGLLVLARVLAGSQVAEDVAQETMLVAYRRWDEVCSYASPVGWLRGVCMHKAVSVVRRRSLEQRLLRQLGSFRLAPTDAGAADDMFWALVRLLPRRQAQAVALHYVLDLGVAEIADIMGCAEGTVKMHLSRARAALATALAVAEEELS